MEIGLIELADIAEELNRLWNSEQGQKKIRASLFSLILYVQKSELTGSYQSLIKSVVSKFPCRVIMILNETNLSKQYLRTSVSSETIGTADLQIFCEIIQIEVAGRLIERVPFIVLPHILPDLPVYLLWTQDPSTESTVLPHLEHLAHRIIFDSKSTEDLQSYCQTLLSLMQHLHCDNIGDLNWSALSGWRNIFTQVFYSQDSLLSLAQSTLIRIYYNNCQTKYQMHTEIQAAYLQAWFASRLNWKFESIEISEGHIRLTYHRLLKEIVVLLVPQDTDTQPPGSILFVEIESAKNKGQYIFKKHPQTQQVLIQYSEEDFCQLPYSAYLPGTTNGQAIVEEIFYPSGGEHYKDMLEVLALIPWRKSR